MDQFCVEEHPLLGCGNALQADRMADFLAPSRNGSAFTTGRCCVIGATTTSEREILTAFLHNPVAGNSLLFNIDDSSMINIQLAYNAGRHRELISVQCTKHPPSVA